MTDQQLQVLVQQISQVSFGRPFQHQARFNTRLRTTGGRYLLQNHQIEINPKMLSEHDEATLVGVIKHELCHYHLHLMQSGYQHKDPEFKQLLQAVGGSRFAPAPAKRQRPKRRYLYQCLACGQEYPRVRRIDVSRYVCSKCHGHLKLMRELARK